MPGSRIGARDATLDGPGIILLVVLMVTGTEPDLQHQAAEGSVSEAAGPGLGAS